MIEKENITSITRLTELLAAHGVYALTIIFIFYQQWRAGQNLKTAKPEDHNYFRKVNTSVVTATYIMVVISTVVWIYATFVYLPKVYIRGSVSGLTEQVVTPQKEGDPPRIIETIAPESLDIDLYESKKNKDETSSEGKYDLGWVLLPRENVHTLVFRFQHRYEKIKSTKRSLLSSIGSANSFEAKKTEKRFTLDLRKISYSAGSPIELMYEPDSEDQVQNIGKIYLREPDTGNRTEVPWEEIRPGKKNTVSSSTEFLFSPANIVYAASKGGAVFAENGDYDPQFGRVLRERLASPDLETQLAARDVLIDNRKRSFKFILDTLNAHSDPNSRGLLVSNLGSVVLDIEGAGETVPRKINLALATAFFDSNDAQSSAQFFDKAGENPEDPPEFYLERGVVYHKVKKYDASFKNLNRYLDKEERRPNLAAAHTILGDAYMELRRDQEAVSHYRKAIQLVPAFAIPYNNLAFLYADRGRNLQEALSLVNRALVLEKDREEIALFKDTKGWTLYKLGRHDEALALLKEAASTIPNDKVIREHLKVIQAASSRGSQ